MPAQTGLGENNSYIGNENHLKPDQDKTFTTVYSTDRDYNNINSGDHNSPEAVNECITEERIESTPTRCDSYSRHKSKCGGPPRPSLISHHKMSFVFDDYDRVDALPKHMSFTYLDAVAILFSIGSFLFDIGTDVAVAAFHYINSDYWYACNPYKSLYELMVFLN